MSKESIARLMQGAELKDAAELLIAGAVAAAGDAAGELLIGAAMKFWDQTYGPGESLRLAHHTLATIAAAMDGPATLN